MARLDDIQGKHDEAMAEFVKLAEASNTLADYNARGDAIGKARRAFADLLQYHKAFRTASTAARQIKRAKQ